jgi:hypothetical protein
MTTFKKSRDGYEVLEWYGAGMRIVGFVKNEPMRIKPWRASNKTESKSFLTRKAAGQWLIATYKPS